MWFTPHGPFNRQGVPGGSDDFFDLFGPEDTWPQAAGYVHVVKIYDEFGMQRATPEQWRAVLTGVADRGMALAMELGPLPETGECGGGEGFGFDHSLNVVRKVQGYGGRVDIVVFDGPYAFGHFYNGIDPVPCRWPLEKIAAETAAFVRALRQIEPNVVVGGLEPTWIELSPQDVADWLDAFEDALGEPLGFIHLDVDWQRSDWPEFAVEVQRLANDRGVPFGIIYNGQDWDFSDEEWTQAAAERAYTFEELYGGRPDHVVFQSWHFHPRRALPETDPATFTGLINRYFGSLTVIEVQADGEVALRNRDGSPVPNGSIRVEALPLGGIAFEIRVEGTVPPGAETAVIGIRINTEGAGPGEADMRIYTISYQEDDGANLVSGVTTWGTGGTGSARVEPSDQGSGSVLHLTASNDQHLAGNSNEFAATEGAEYVFTSTAAVPVESADSGYLAVIFLGSSGEVERRFVPLQPSPIALGSLTTDSAGSAFLNLQEMKPGRYRLRLSYPGDLTHWPSYLEEELVVE